MARIARVVLPGYPHHVTQRGNRRQRVFFNNDDYTYLLAVLFEQGTKPFLASEIWTQLSGGPNRRHRLTMISTCILWISRASSVPKGTQESVFSNEQALTVHCRQG
jgi:hypothetical protein